jgi:hypothetical protein
VQSLLLGSPDSLWITRGTPFWGPDAEIKRFAVLYEGTWRLDPEPSSLKVIMIGDGRCASLRPDHVHNRSARPTATADEIPDESGVGQNAKRLETIEHPAHILACAITLARYLFAIGCLGL